MLTAHVIGDYTHVTDLVYSEYVPSIRVSYGLDLTDDENILTTVVNLHGQPLKIFSTKYDEFLDGSGTPYSTVDRDDALREFAGQNSSKDVNIQDQTTPAVISRANLTHAETTVAIETVIDTYTVTVASATGISIGDYLVLFNPTERRFSSNWSINNLRFPTRFCISSRIFRECWNYKFECGWLNNPCSVWRKRNDSTSRISSYRV
jgi:hypothetical protein